ncbi:MAG: hypothetical protein A3G75_00715 [Verrucomicrobia bacterium RIFCSPLOWO2_12_FULL_64_8]|nr:MAG: hypothetical protein A3G75_00715 [Verrucomicrobia bacterium RIFCSPLOWO2_12_FULL_64_8]
MNRPPSEKPPANNLPAAPHAENTPAAPDFDEQVRTFWEKNRNSLLTVCVAVILAILVRGAWDWQSARREAGIQAAFAAATAPEKLRAFSRDHVGHPLAGAAHLKLADDAYAAGRYAEALSDYEKAGPALPDTPFAARALLGKAMCLIQSGKDTDGMAILNRLADDATQMRATRCEAAYHLAGLALAAGKYDEATKRVDLIMQLDSGGLTNQRASWAQLAMLLRIRIPVPMAPGAAAPAGQKGESTPAASIKLPGS